MFGDEEMEDEPESSSQTKESLYGTPRSFVLGPPFGAARNYLLLTYWGGQKKNEGLGLLHFVSILVQRAIAIQFCTMSYKSEEFPPRAHRNFKLAISCRVSCFNYLCLSLRASP